MNNNVTASKDVTPLLGDIPILGALFRSVRYTRKETELVVLVTPRLVDAMNPGQVPALPGEHWRNPKEGELFWLQDIGGEVAAPTASATTRTAAATGTDTNTATEPQTDVAAQPQSEPEPIATRPAAAAPVTRGPAPLFRGDFGFVPTTQPVAGTSDEPAER